MFFPSVRTMVDDKSEIAVGGSFCDTLWHMHFYRVWISVKEACYHMCDDSVQAGKRVSTQRKEGFPCVFREKTVGPRQLREALAKTTEKQ